VLVAAVEEGIAGPESWLELGPGGQDYKYRLADTDAELVWVTLSAARR
jgi:hypothetical protein